MHVCAHDEERFELDIRSFEVLATYDWPGNVRELKHVIELALLLSGDHAIGAHVIADALGEVITPVLRKSKMTSRAPAF